MVRARRSLGLPSDACPSSLLRAPARKIWEQLLARAVDHNPTQARSARNTHVIAEFDAHSPTGRPAARSVAAVVRAISILPLAACCAAAVAMTADAAWRSPVPGSTTRGFDLGPNPYAAGQHRGADLAARPGDRVRSACRGRVSFAGRVPGGGWTVSVRCGRLIATHQHLAALEVRRGRAVRAGTTIGRVGRSGRPRPHVHLGARVAASGRYVDPLGLIADPGLGPAPPPAVPAGRREPPHGARAPRPVTAPVRVRHDRAPAPAPASLPWTAWLGLLLLGPAVGLGSLVRRRGGRRAAATAPTRVGEVLRARR